MATRTWDDVDDGLFTAHRETVRAGWLDYNDHMNVAYYVLAFDHATDSIFAAFGIDDAYRAAENKSIFVAESHIVYLAEAVRGERLRFASRILAYRDKKLHLFHEMFSEKSGALIATTEVMVIHVDLDQRRAMPFGAPVAAPIAAMAAVHAGAGAPPPQAGRSVGL